jgi:integrase
MVMSRFPSSAVHYRKTPSSDGVLSVPAGVFITMPRPRNLVPAYSRHKTTQQAVCTVRLANGQRKVIYLGKWQSAASKADYARIVALVSANAGIYPESTPDLTVNEALVRYIKHVDAYYVDPNGWPCRSADNIKAAVGYLKRLFGRTPLAEFGPPEFKVIRAELIDKGIVRKQVNKYGGMIRQFFRWCVEEGLVHSSVWETLRAVRPLLPGRSGAKDPKPRKPADPSAVEKALAFMSPAVRAIVQMLRLTGARPSEILTLRPCDVDRSVDPWTYSPAQHKTSYKGKLRVIQLGPKAQAVLTPWLIDTEESAYVFSPARSEALRNADRGEQRKTPRWPSHLARNERKRPRKRRRPPTDRYEHVNLSQAVRRACRRAEVEPFSPYCLRHLKAVELRETHGLETVRAVLGQSCMAVAEHYAKQADAVLASKAAAEAG